MSVIFLQIKQILPNLIKCYYFSDGAGCQYKNYKNFANLCHHQAGVGVDVEWNFSATSHGKSPCDGISGTGKHLVACVSLQMVSGQTITSSNELFNWCKENISGISFICVSAEDVEKHSELIVLEKCYESDSAVPGTRSYHCFMPTSTNELQLKQISADPYHSTFQSGKMKTRISLNDIMPGQYYACMYDDNCYVGIANDCSFEYQDVCFKFLKKKKAFQIIFLGLQDRLSQEELNKITSLFINFYE